MPDQPNPQQRCCTTCVAISKQPLPRTVGLRVGLTSRLEPFATVAQEAVRLPCTDEDCTNCTTVVVTALSRVNTTESSVDRIASDAAITVANDLKESESLCRRISRCFKTISATKKATDLGSCVVNSPTIFSVTGGNMKDGVGEGVLGERAKLVGGYRLSLLDWGKNRSKMKSRDEEDRSSMQPETVTGIGITGGDSGIEVEVEPRTTSERNPSSLPIDPTNSMTVPPGKEPLENYAQNDPSPPSSPPSKERQSRKGKGKSPLSFFRKSSESSGAESNSDSDSDSDSFNFDPPEFETATSKEEEPIIPHPSVFTATRLAQVPIFELVNQSMGSNGSNEDCDMKAYIPTASQCAAHLELLGCFSKLRADVESSEAIGSWLFGTEKFADETNATDATTTSSPGDIKWRAFVGKAVERFHLWWINFPLVVEELDRVKKRGVADDKRPDFELVRKAGAHGTGRDTERRNSFLRQWKKKKTSTGSMGADVFKGLHDFQKDDFASHVKFRTLTADMLPPLDVLLVWHAYTLNPRAFYEDCIRLDRLEMWGTPLPWDSIHDAIDNYNFTYALPPAAATFFQKITGQPPSLYESLIAEVGIVVENSDKTSRSPQQKSLCCPWCQKSFNVSLGEWHKAGDVADYNGVCGNCHKRYDKEVVAVSMFLRDLQHLLRNEIEKEKQQQPKDEDTNNTSDILLRGGVLQPLSGHYIPPTHPHASDPSYPSHSVISGVLRSAFPSLCPSTDDTTSDFTSLLTTFENTSTLLSHLHSHLHISHNQEQTVSPIPTLKRILTNIVSTYKHLPPPTASTPALLSTDLAAAVLRQGVFIKRIHDDARLIRSPALAGTLSRSRDRYEKFFRLIGKYRGTIFVPTTEIDLLWHTQQCYPKLYYTFSNLVTGIAGDAGVDWQKRGAWRYVDHNDRLDKGILGNGFEDTERLWKVEYVSAELVEPAPKGWKRVFGDREKSPPVSLPAEEDENEGAAGEEGNKEKGVEAEQKGQGGVSEINTPAKQRQNLIDNSENCDGDRKYNICVNWVCELRKNMEEEKTMREGKRAVEERFTRKEEWGMRATVHYYRMVEQARVEGKMLPVWRDGKQWMRSS